MAVPPGSRPPRLVARNVEHRSLGRLPRIELALELCDAPLPLLQRTPVRRGVVVAPAGRRVELRLQLRARALRRARRPPQRLRLAARLRQRHLGLVALFPPPPRRLGLRLAPFCELLPRGGELRLERRAHGAGRPVLGLSN